MTICEFANTCLLCDATGQLSLRCIFAVCLSVIHTWEGEKPCHQGRAPHPQYRAALQRYLLEEIGPLAIPEVVKALAIARVMFARENRLKRSPVRISSNFGFWGLPFAVGTISFEVFAVGEILIKVLPIELGGFSRGIATYS